MKEIPSRNTSCCIFSRHGSSPWILFFSVGLVVVVLDLWTKSWAFQALDMVIVSHPDTGRPFLQNANGLEDDRYPGVPYQERIEVIPYYFLLEANLNMGAYHGWFADYTGFLAFLSFAAVFIIAGILLVLLRRPEKPSLWLIWAMALLWGGTLGNFYDRYFIGAVRDFIRWAVPVPGFWPSFLPWYFDPWPNFNIADSSICVGVGLVLFWSLFLGGKPGAEKGPASA